MLSEVEGVEEGVEEGERGVECECEREGVEESKDVAAASRQQHPSHCTDRRPAAAGSAAARLRRRRVGRAVAGRAADRRTAAPRASLHEHTAQAADRSVRAHATWHRACA